MKPLSRTALSILLFLALISPVGTSFAESKTVTIGSKASVAATIELIVSGQRDSELRFGNVAPSASEETVAGPMSMTVEVKSNTGERYQVMHQLNGNLQNESGASIPIENLSFASRSSQAKGTYYESQVDLSPKYQTIYISDAAGTGDIVNVDYYLKVPAKQAPGNYSATITYTASTL